MVSWDAILETDLTFETPQLAEAELVAVMKHSVSESGGSCARIFGVALAADNGELLAVIIEADAYL